MAFVKKYKSPKKFEGLFLIGKIFNQGFISPILHGGGQIDPPWLIMVR